MTAATTRMAEALPPLSEKAQTSADESYDYALDHGLFLHLLTEEHLEYHYSFAKQQYALSPYADKALDEQNLPPLTIPAVTTKEDLIVHQRVASVLQSASQWLSDDALVQCETEFVQGQHEKAAEKPKVGPDELKLDCPIASSDFDEDCAELRRTVARFQSCNGMQLGDLQESKETESEIFDIPKTNCYDNDMMATKPGSATFTADEQTIRWLATYVNDHQWNHDVGEYVFQDPTAQDVRCRRMSSPLPPVLSIDEYLPEGDVCCVSEGSDMSSSLGEYVAAAVNAIPQRSPVDFEEAPLTLETLLVKTDALNDAMGSPTGDIDDFHFQRNSIEDDIPFYTSDLLQTDAKTPRMTVEDENVIFEDFIADSVYCASSDGAQPDVKEPLSIQNEALPTSQLQSSSDELGFETVTAELLLGLEEDDRANQAKIPVPDINTTESPPEWEHVAADANNLFQWMVHAHHKALWEDACKGLEAWQFDEELNKMTAKAAEIPEEQWVIDGDEVELSTWLGHDQTEEHICYRIFDVEADTKEAQNDSEEEQLEQWVFSPKQPHNMVKRRKLLVASQKPQIAVPTSSKEEPPETNPERPSRKGLSKTDNANAWGALISRFQRRKNDGTTRPSEAHSDYQARPTETLRITAPELVIGSRAFASAPAQTEKRDDSRHNSTVTAQQTQEDEDEDLSDADPVIVASGTLPKVILSATVPRTIRTRILQMLPRLKFVEREYKQYAGGLCSIDTEDEADIVTSPGSGIILTKMVSLRQMDSRRRPLFQSHLAKVSRKYETLSVLVYRNSPTTFGSNQTGDTQDLSPSDAISFSQLVGFTNTKTLACAIRVSYIIGGETAVARHAAKLISLETTDKDMLSEAYLVEEATDGERFLRQAGLNVYDAQIVLGLSGEDGAGNAGFDLVDRFIGMTAEERSDLFGNAVGCRRALASAGQLFTVNIN